MRAKFIDGPYDGLEVQVKEGLQWVQLQVHVSPAIQIADAVTYTCLARYELIMRNDYISHYRFRSLSGPG